MLRFFFKHVFRTALKWVEYQQNMKCGIQPCFYKILSDIKEDKDIAVAITSVVKAQFHYMRKLPYSVVTIVTYQGIQEILSDFNDNTSLYLQKYLPVLNVFS